MIARLAACCLLAGAAFAQSGAAREDGQRMEILLERLEGDSWHAIDPGLVLEQSDRVRFRFRTNFDGYLYVMNQNTSGKYEQLFPREETGQDNHIVAGKQYQVPATDTLFRIAGPPGHEIVYWLLAPARLTGGAPRYPAERPHDLQLLPRCDDTILKSRGDCIDHAAGPKLVPRDVPLPQGLADAADQSRRDLLFLQQKDTAVISSPAPLTGPVIYEFHLAHR